MPVKDYVRLGRAQGPESDAWKAYLGIPFPGPLPASSLQPFQPPSAAGTQPLSLPPPAAAGAPSPCALQVPLRLPYRCALLQASASSYQPVMLGRFLDNVLQLKRRKAHKPAGDCHGLCMRACSLVVP